MSSTSSAAKHRGSVLIGLLLVALGVLLLLNVTGAVGFGIWLELVKYWPVLLVLIGLEIILARSDPLLRAGLIAATLVAVIATAFFSMPEYDPDEPLHATFVEPMSDIKTLHLNADFMGSSLQLSSETPAVEPDAGLLAAKRYVLAALRAVRTSQSALRIGRSPCLPTSKSRSTSHQALPT